MADWIDIITQRMQSLQSENDALEGKLKTVAKNIQSLGIEQPAKCLFAEGCCCYPIDDCYNCPMHIWNDYIPTSKAVII